MSTTDPKSLVSWSEGRRLRAWELHQMGWAQNKIAQALGVSPAAVSQWFARAKREGVQTLHAQPIPGRPPLLTALQHDQLQTLLAQGAEDFGFLGAVWTRRRVAQLIKDEFGINYHPAHVSRLLKQLDWTPQRPVVRATQRDETAIDAWYTERWPALKKSACKKAELSSS